MSIPNGGAVSIYDWQLFVENKLGKTFDGFNVVDSLGFYEGKPERSKIVTFIVKEKEIPKLKNDHSVLAQLAGVSRNK